MKNFAYKIVLITAKFFFSFYCLVSAVLYNFLQIVSLIFQNALWQTLLRPCLHGAIQVWVHWVHVDSWQQLKDCPIMIICIRNTWTIFFKIWNQELEISLLIKVITPIYTWKLDSKHTNEKATIKTDQWFDCFGLILAVQNKK